MRFRVLNKDPLYDYREECKLTQGEAIEADTIIKWERLQTQQELEF